MIWKEAVVAYYRHYPGIYKEELGKNQKNPVKIADSIVKARTQPFPNMSPKRYGYAGFLVVCFTF
jgi:hypothetical protein